MLERVGFRREAVGSQERCRVHRLREGPRALEAGERRQCF